MNPRILTILIILFLSQTISFSAFAQKKESALRLEDIYRNSLYQDKGYGPIRWSKDNKGYLTFESNIEIGGKDIVMYDAKSGARSVICSAGLFVPEGSDKPLIISDYIWAGGNRKLLIFKKSRR